MDYRALKEDTLKEVERLASLPDPSRWDNQISICVCLNGIKLMVRNGHVTFSEHEKERIAKVRSLAQLD